MAQTKKLFCLNEKLRGLNKNAMVQIINSKALVTSTEIYLQNSKVQSINFKV